MFWGAWSQQEKTVAVYLDIEKYLTLHDACHIANSLSAENYTGRRVPKSQRHFLGER
ncbi:MAG: hypothetical protein HQL69_21470 [Magnetococcales bacterium]|nr:hypothetical protein [Magnetococcales bacterium]